MNSSALGGLIHSYSWDPLQWFDILDLHIQWPAVQLNSMNVLGAFSYNRILCLPGGWFICFFISLFANCPQSQQHVFISPGCLHWHTQVKHLERHHMDIPLSLWTLMRFTFYDINTVHTVYCSAQTVQLKVLLSFPAVPVSHFFLSGFNEVSVMLMPLQGWQWSFIIILQYRWSFYLSMAP